MIVDSICLILQSVFYWYCYFRLFKGTSIIQESMTRRELNHRDRNKQSEEMLWRGKHMHPLFKYDEKIKEYIRIPADGEGNVGIGKTYLDENMPDPNAEWRETSAIHRPWNKTESVLL
jgi:hypothetical protein